MFLNNSLIAGEIAEDPLSIFKYIKDQNTSLLEEVLSRNFDFNIEDESKNNVLMSLLINRQYDLVYKYMNLKDIDINHQNEDGDTFLHILCSINYSDVINIINKLNLRKDILLNIKNNNGETILDKAICKEFIYTTIKILEDDRFSDLNFLSLKKIYNTYFKNNEYGEYSKFMAFNLILKKEELIASGSLKKFINLLGENKDRLKDEISKNNYNLFEEIFAQTNFL